MEKNHNPQKRNLIASISRREALLMAAAAFGAVWNGCSNGNSPIGSSFPDFTPHPIHTPPDGRAVTYLREVMDRFHKTFDVFTDSDAGGNHFPVRAKIFSVGGIDALPPLNDTFKDDSGDGINCIECQFLSQGNNWGGWIFQNGILPNGSTTPQQNWGTVPNAGFNLTGATKLTFWARGAVGEEMVEFFCLGVGRDAATGMPMPNTPFPDSSPKATTGVITLTNQWQQFTIDLKGKDLSYVLGGFGWVASAENNPRNITFYLDSIQYDLPRLQQPRFLLSYKTIRSDSDFDRTQRNAAYTYDTCVGVLAFLAAGDLDRAKLLADAIIYAQEHDRFYSDGRIRNAYAAGDNKTFPAWLANGMNNTARLPGWTDPMTKTFLEDFYAAGTSTGNMAWSMLALLAVYRVTMDSRYLQSALNMWKWVEDNCRDKNPNGIGYTGGVEGFENNPNPRTYKSTEHNLDLAACAKAFKEFTNDPVWDARYANAKQFVLSMWNAPGNNFWTGTGDDGVTPFKDVIPLDIQVWVLESFLEEATPYVTDLDFVEKTFRVGEGYDFNQDRDGIWREGTGQVALAYHITGKPAECQRIVQYLLSVQDPSGGIPAASKDNLTTGFMITKTITWFYFNRLHIAPTAWLILAQSGYNPFHPDRGPMVGIYVNSNAAKVGVGQTMNFTATVVGYADDSVIWSVQEGPTGGTINPETGAYTAPLTPGVYHLNVVSKHNSQLSGMVTVTVVAGSFIGTVRSSKEVRKHGR